MPSSDSSNSTIKPDFVCPTDHTPLRAASAETVARVNRAIAEGKLKNCAGRLLDRSIDGALIREDGALLYPIVEGIPIMLPDEAIPMADVKA